MSELDRTTRNRKISEKFNRPFILASLSLVSANDGVCLPGSALQTGVDWQMYVPIPGMSERTSGPPAPASPAWATRWGAIVVDMAMGGTGVSAVSGMKTEGQASKSAMHACKKKNGTRCTVKITYHDQCAAVITGDTVFSTASAASVEEVARIAIDWCNGQGGTNCRLYFSDCSYPERIR